MVICESDFKATVRERNAAMFLNEWLADVYFIVGTENVCNLHIF